MSSFPRFPSPIPLPLPPPSLHPLSAPLSPSLSPRLASKALVRELLAGGPWGAPRWVRPRHSGGAPAGAP